MSIDYKGFYGDVVDWIQQANQAAMKHGIGHEDFWKWVTDSCGALGKKYGDHRLVIKQMLMLIEWLEEVYEKGNSHE